MSLRSKMRVVESRLLLSACRLALHLYHRDLLRKMTTGPGYLRRLYAETWLGARRSVRKTNNTKEVSDG